MGSKLSTALHQITLYIRKPYKRSPLYLFITPFTQSKNYPDRTLVYRGHLLFNTTKRITLLFIVQSLLHCTCNPLYIWIKIIHIAIKILCLHGTKFLDPDCDLDPDLDYFAPCKRVYALSMSRT